MPRPRVHPPGTSRVTARLARVRAAGGARREFVLSAETQAAIAAIRARGRDASDTALIERLVAEETRRAQ